MADYPKDEEEKPWFRGGRAQGQSRSLKDGECGGASKRMSVREQAVGTAGRKAWSGWRGAVRWQMRDHRDRGSRSKGLSGRVVRPQELW